MHTKGTNRRAFLGRCLSTLASYSVLRYAMGTGCLASEAQGLMGTWLRDMTDLCYDLNAKTISPELWQDRMAILYRDIDPSDLMAFIDFEQLIQRLQWPEAGAAIAKVPLPVVEGLKEPRGFGHKIFALKKGRAIVPHAHNNTVSAHFVLQGAFHVRTYNRRFDLEQGDGYLVLEPSRDTVFGPGELLTMSDTRDNVHWLEATTAQAVTFDVPISGISTNHHYLTPANKYGMIFIEPPKPTNAGPQAARVIGLAEALARFG